MRKNTSINGLQPTSADKISIAKTVIHEPKNIVLEHRRCLEEKFQDIQKNIGMSSKGESYKALIVKNHILQETDMNKKRQSTNLQALKNYITQTITQIKSQIKEISKALFEETKARKRQIQVIHQQFSEQSQDNIQKTQRIRQIISEMEKGFQDQLYDLKNDMIALQQKDSSERYDTLQKSIQLIRLEIAEIKQNPVESVELKDVIAELNNKISINDIQEAFVEIKEKLTVTMSASENSHSIVCELKDDHERMYQRIKSMEKAGNSVNLWIENQESEIENMLENCMRNLQQSIEENLTRIVGSYNLNFQEIENNNIQVKQMLSQILKINNVLSQRLIGIVTNKLDAMTFQDTIQNINSKIQSGLDLNNKKLSQIGEKEFEFEHELRCLKQILDGLKTDYERNYNKLKIEDDKSITENTDRRLSSKRIKDSICGISPNSKDIINFEYHRFRKCQTLNNSRNASFEKKYSQSKPLKTEQDESSHVNLRRNILAEELSELEN